MCVPGYIMMMCVSSLAASCPLPFIYHQGVYSHFLIMLESDTLGHVATLSDARPHGWHPDLHPAPSSQLLLG